MLQFAMSSKARRSPQDKVLLAAVFLSHVAPNACSLPHAGGFLTLPMYTVRRLSTLLCQLLS